MTTGVGSSSRREKLELDEVEDELDALSREELNRRPEVRLINRLAFVQAHIAVGMKGVGALALLWATVVLLGGFVSLLHRKDFWFITFIALVNAAGMVNAFTDIERWFLGKLVFSTVIKLFSLREKHHVHTQSELHPTFRETYLRFWLKRAVLIIISKLRDLIMLAIISTVNLLVLYSVLICAGLAVIRLRDPGYRSEYGSSGNMKPALDLYYYLCCAQGAIFLLFWSSHVLGMSYLVTNVRQQLGFSQRLVRSYRQKIESKYVNNLGAHDDWNFITYGFELLDSEIPEDNASGARVLTLLIDQGIQIRRVLIRSPRGRIQKLIGALVCRSRADREMRWLAARIVAHLARDLNLAQFPGALECISSLLDTSGHKNGDQDALRVLNGRGKGKKMIHIYEGPSPYDGKGTSEDLILQGLTILGNLADDEHNCTLIYNTKGLLSRIVALVCSINSVEIIKINETWIKVIDESLRVVSRLMGAPGDTGKEMCRQIADSSNAVQNLEAFLRQASNSTGIIELQIRTIEVLTQLFLVDSSTLTREKRENLIAKALHIFLDDKWMEDIETARPPKKSKKAWKALVEEKKTQLREKAGEVVAMLSMGNESTPKATMNSTEASGASAVPMLSLGNLTIAEAARIFTGPSAVPMTSSENQASAEDIRSFTGASAVPTSTEYQIKVVDFLTEMLNSKKKTIKCRIGAAVILKNLCAHCTLDPDYAMETLRKVLIELLHITEPQEQGTSTPCCCVVIARQEDEPSALESQVEEQPEERRRLKATLLSLICAAFRAKLFNADDFASVAMELGNTPENFVEKLKEMVEENSYATPACLAILKLTCEMVTEFIPHGRIYLAMQNQGIIDTLSQASEKMVSLESSMLFDGTDEDCYGVPVKPLSSEIVKAARQHLR